MSEPRPKLRKNASMKTIIRERFGIHRGLAKKGYILNSLKAIAAAVVLEPPFVEFDISLVNGELLTGHPPQEPLDALSGVLDLFVGKKTYPKIDIKRRSNESLTETIDQTIGVIEQKQIGFTLINIGTSGRDREDVLRMEMYLTRKAAHNPAIRLNIDIERYKSVEKEISRDKGIQEHVNKLGSFVFSISPEIYSNDYEAIARFARKHGIGKLVFWFYRGRHAMFNVTEEKIRAALALEKRYPFVVYFDINKTYISDNGTKSLSLFSSPKPNSGTQTPSISLILVLLLRPLGY